MNCLFLLLSAWTISASNEIPCSQSSFQMPSHCEIVKQKVLPTDRFGNPESQEIYELFITFSDMPVIPEKVFVYNPKLLFVSIFECRTTRITKNVFANAVQLQKFFIQKNNIPMLTNNTFISCKSLEKLELNGNKIVQIESAVFQGLSRLGFLSLADNLVEDFPPTMLYPLVALQMFHALGNKLKSIDELFFNKNPFLTYVDLSNNQLTTLPATLFSVHSFLDSIILQNNLINIANIDFPHVDLSNNMLTTFFVGSNIKKLNLQNNFIESIQCSKVLKVNAFVGDNNSLTSFHCITEMVHLTFLSLSRNKFKKPAPQSFVNLKVLQNFDICDSKSSVKWQASFFKGLNYLIILRIDKLFTYKFVKTYLPNLSMLALATSKWNCEFFQRVNKTLDAQKILLRNTNPIASKVCPVVN